MKNRLNFVLGLSAVALCSVFSACDKKDDASPTIVSRVTTYPVISLNGAPIISVVKGQSFTDPGATTKVGNDTAPSKASGTVDTNTLGVYTISYVGTNPDGFTATTSRFVAVVDPSVASEDLSGTYARTSNGAITEVKKLGNGIYSTSNLGGVAASNPAAIVPAYFAQVSPTELVFPAQSVPGIGDTSFKDVTPVVTGGKITGWKYIVINAGFGQAVRTFLKQ